MSNGGSTAMRLAMRHPDLVRRQIIASTMHRRDGMPDGFWDGFDDADISQMPEPYLAADREINPDDPHHQQLLFDLDVTQMRDFTDWPAGDLAAMHTPTLFVSADRDVVLPAHTVEMANLAPDARVLIVPGNHGDYLGERLACAGDPATLRRTLPWLVDFLDQP